MLISWYGEACFLLESGGVRILTDPPAKDSGLSSPRLKADVLILTQPNEDFNAPEETFVVANPGEYEIKDAVIHGAGHASKKGETAVYLIEMDGIKIAHLGYLSEDLKENELEILNNPDVILLPVGGGGVLDAEEAVKVMNKIEPRLVIPSLFSVKGLKLKRSELRDFMKESGSKEAPQPKIAIKKKDLDPETMRIVPLEQI